MIGQLEALASLRLSWVTDSRDVWRDADTYVPQLHHQAAAEVRQRIIDARGHDLRQGLVVEGEAGSGKTQLLGWVREQTQHDGGYFFLINLQQGETFWQSVVEALLDGLQRDHVAGDSQLRLLMRRLGERAGTSRMVRAVVEGSRVSRAGLDKFVAGLSASEGWRPELASTARALAMLAAEDPATQELARAHLASEELPAEDRAEYGLGAARGPERTVMQLSRVLALTGSSVLAVDQLDSLFARAASAPERVDSDYADAARDHVINQVSEGLMSLREDTERTLVLLACIPNSWRLIQKYALASVADRFYGPLTLDTIPGPDVARQIVERHLGARFRRGGFAPPYPTWPVRPEALGTVGPTTPRLLLQRIDAHVRACLAAEAVTELTRLDGVSEVVVPPTRPTAEPAGHAELDARFIELREQAVVDGALDPRREDLEIPPLLRAGIEAWIAERGPAVQAYEADPSPSSNPPLHAGVRRTVDERTEADVRCSFRAIAHPNALAVQNRLRRALQQSGVEAGDDTRRLVILRRAGWPSGPKTAELVAEFTRRGGLKLDVDPDDLRTFEALRKLLQEKHSALSSWLVARRPAGGTGLLRAALPTAGQVDPGTDPPERPEVSAIPVSGTSGTGGSPDGPAVSVGTIGGDRSWIELEALRKHVAVFAGSGSGKTVLLRRLVEECALQGVSAVVLDPNNDLARLGDAWPERPAGWLDEDPRRSADYLAGTDVVVWTPGLRGGRPLTFQPLPDFGGVADDPDEFDQAVNVAVAALAPRARVDGRTTKAERQRAVLRESVVYFGRHGGGTLPAFFELLRELPEHVSSIDGAPDMAADMAETLKATRVNDPLFGGAGVPVDPGLLLAPADGKRARVSVISFVGLADEQRPGFVSQLQMALFSWFKRHPAADRPLGGLLVMDEAQTFAPSGALTPASESTLILASQARKYGLGLVFATQAPKALHNRIPGNAATQFFGRLNAPNQITTARELARAKGGDVSDIARLGAGDFYLAAEGREFQRMKTLNCLSHHPPSPLGREEVIARAQGG